MDLGDQCLDIRVGDHQPVVTVGILGLGETVGPVHLEQLDHLGLHLLEPLSGRRLEADTGMPRTGQAGGTLEGDGGRGECEQCVEVRLDRFGPPEDGVEQSHQRTPPINGCDSPAMSPNRRDHEGLPNSASILASWARRWSKEGCVEKMVDRLTPLLAMAGVK